MGILELIVLALLAICMVVNLYRNRDFQSFLGAIVIDGILIGFLYVILHMLIKHW